MNDYDKEDEFWDKVWEIDSLNDEYQWEVEHRKQ